MSAVLTVRTRQSSTAVESAIFPVVQEHSMAAESIEFDSFYADLLRNLPGMVYRCTNQIDYRMQFISEGCHELTGYTSDELTNSKVIAYGDLIHPDDRGRVWQTIQDTIGRHSSFVMEYRIINRNGETRWVWEKGSAALSGNDKVLDGFILDVTSRIYSESRQRMEHKMESVARLAGGIAHDFNNQLGVIIGYAEMLLEKSRTESELSEGLYEILAAGKKSREVTKQLLSFARQQNIRPITVELNQVVDKILPDLRQLLGNDIDLAWHPHTDLWPVEIDPEQIVQILINLCSNARDAADGRGKVIIETANVVLDNDYCFEHQGFVPGNYVLLAVGDKGRGIGKELIDNIFEPFFTTKDAAAGVGMGLPTVYGIVKQNHGFINVYSEEGLGTSVKIYLPQRSTKSLAESRQTSTTEAGNQEIILLVEDEPALMKMIKMMLERLGYKVVAAGSPVKASEITENHKLSLLITDLVMPEMNGHELAARIRAGQPELPVLYISGYTSSLVTSQNLLETSARFLQKPFSIEDLSQAVSKILNSHQTGHSG